MIAMVVWLCASAVMVLVIMFFNVRQLKARVRTWSSNKVFMFAFTMGIIGQRRSNVLRMGGLDDEEINLFRKYQNVCSVEIIVLELLLYMIFMISMLFVPGRE
jgi:hypothetical protein